MGGIDLDAASHPIANRQHRIPDYFHINRSAFEHDWYGRVWLNPPYGHNAPWFERIEQFVASGEVEQLCMLSPLWAFTTEQARPVMRLSAANEKSKTGTNQPHGVVYFGHRVDEFLAAFASHGIPLEVAWDRVANLAPVEDEVAA